MHAPTDYAAVTQGLKWVGISDPAAASLWPQEAIPHFLGFPIVIIEREPEYCKASIMKWATLKEVPNWQVILDNYESFKAQVGDKALYLDYNDLDRYAPVNRLCKHLTGSRLDVTRFELFKKLDIQQHFLKAQEQWRRGQHKQIAH